MTCEYCGNKTDLPFKCSYCGGIFCSEHHLPEQHDCIVLEKWSKFTGLTGNKKGFYYRVWEEQYEILNTKPTIPKNRFHDPMSEMSDEEKQKVYEKLHPKKTECTESKQKYDPIYTDSLRKQVEREQVEREQTTSTPEFQFHDSIPEISEEKVRVAYKELDESKKVEHTKVKQEYDLIYTDSLRRQIERERQEFNSIKVEYPKLRNTDKFIVLLFVAIIFIASIAFICHII